MKGHASVIKTPGIRRRRTLAALVVSLVCLLIFISQSPAKTVRTAPQVAGGVVTDIHAASIEVNGKSYDISQAKIVTTDGRKVTREYIQKGSRVGLMIYDGEVTMVRVDNNTDKHIKK